MHLQSVTITSCRRSFHSSHHVRLVGRTDLQLAPRWHSRPERQGSVTAEQPDCVRMLQMPLDWSNRAPTTRAQTSQTQLSREDIAQPPLALRTALQLRMSVRQLRQQMCPQRTVQRDEVTTPIMHKGRSAGQGCSVLLAWFNQKQNTLYTVYPIICLSAHSNARQTTDLQVL